MMQHIGQTIWNAFSRTPRTDPVAKAPDQAHGERLTAAEITHLGHALDIWSGDSNEKREIVQLLLRKAENGAVKVTIKWDHDMPDMLGSRFVVVRASDVLRSASHAEVERLQAECAQKRKNVSATDKEAASEELDLINHCIDRYEAGAPFDADSPLAMKMVELGARACQLIMQIYGKPGCSLAVKISPKDKICDLVPKDRKSSYFMAWLSEIGFLKLQIALLRLDRVKQGVEVGGGLRGWIDGRLDPHDPNVYEQLTDSDVRELFHDDVFGYTPLYEPLHERYKRDVHVNALLPRWEELLRQDAELAARNTKQAISAGYPVPDAVANLVYGWVSGPEMGPEGADLKRYAEGMALLLANGKTDAQHPEMTIKAYNDYLDASSSDPTLLSDPELKLDWSKLKQCVASVGEARGDKAFADEDAEKAYQRLLAAEPPAENQP